MVKFLVTEPLGMVAVSHLSYEGYRGSGSITDPLGVVAAGCARSQGVREVASSQSQTPPPHTHTHRDGCSEPHELSGSQKQWFIPSCRCGAVCAPWKGAEIVNAWSQVTIMGHLGAVAAMSLMCS